MNVLLHLHALLFEILAPYHIASTATATGLVLIADIASGWNSGVVSASAATAVLLVGLHGVAVHACPSAVVLALLSAAGL